MAGWNGVWYASEEISEAWKQNRRDSRHTEETREAVGNALTEAIEHLLQRNQYLKGKISSPNVSEAEKDYYRFEIVRNEGILTQRESEREQFLSGGATEAVPVLPDQVHPLDQLVESAGRDLREDFLSIFRKYAELNRARTELNQLRNNLAARRDWLAKYDQAHPQSAGRGDR